MRRVARHLFTLRPVASTRPWVYFALSAGFLAALLASEFALIPHRRYEPDNLSAAGVLLGLAVLLSYGGVRARRAQRKRSLPGLCPKCGYDLRASPARCPECGAVRTHAKATV